MAFYTYSQETDIKAASANVDTKCEQVFEEYVNIEMVCYNMESNHIVKIAYSDFMQENTVEDSTQLDIDLV